jgi:hypothetical protein
MKYAARQQYIRATDVREMDDAHRLTLQSLSLLDERARPGINPRL